MSGALFYTGVIGFASGIFIRSFFVIDIWFLSSLCVGVVAACVWAGRCRPHWRLVVASIALAMCAGTVGIIRTDVPLTEKESAYARAYLGQEVEIIGTVIREPDMRERTLHLTVASELIGGEPIQARLLVTADRFADVRYGDRISAAGTIGVPERFETGLGREFDYPGYLAARGIYATMSFADIRVLEHGGNPMVAGLLTLKERFIESVERALPEPQAGLGEGLLLGVKRAIGSDLEEAFRMTGIIHIVVLSGYNITLVAEATMRFLSAFFMPRTRFVIGVSVIAAFAVLVGLSATVARASIMAFLVLVARVTGKTYAVMRALAVSAVAMLILNPLLLVFDPGFQLSFLATIGLILLAPIIETRLGFLPTRFQVREFVTATIATQIFVLPILLYSVGELSVVSLVVNPLVLIMVPFAMLTTFLTGLLGLLTPLAALPFGYVAYIALTYIIGVAERFSSIPYAALAVPAFPFWAVFVMYGVMAAGVWYWWSRRTRLVIS